jgi:hypothetical protein
MQGPEAVGRKLGVGGLDSQREGSRLEVGE